MQTNPRLDCECVGLFSSHYGDINVFTQSHCGDLNSSWGQIPHNVNNHNILGQRLSLRSGWVSRERMAVDLMSWSDGNIAVCVCVRMRRTLKTLPPSDNRWILQDSESFWHTHTTLLLPLALSFTNSHHTHVKTHTHAHTAEPLFHHICEISWP